MRYVEPSSLTPGIEMYLAKGSLSKDSSLGIALIFCSTLDSFFFLQVVNIKEIEIKLNILILWLKPWISFIIPFYTR